MPTMVELWQIYFGLQRIRCLLIPKQRWLGGLVPGPSYSLRGGCAHPQQRRSHRQISRDSSIIAAQSGSDFRFKYLVLWRLI